MNKGWVTNAIALAAFLGSYGFSGPFSEWMKMAGLFALSGAVTNQLAIHMLFEKVPFLYGSGIILDRFESIRLALKQLIMEQFFSPEKIDQFVSQNEHEIDMTPIIEETDFTPAYEALVQSVMESPMGGMIGMFGGEALIGKLQEPFIHKIKASTIEIAKSPSFKQALHHRIYEKKDNIGKTIEIIVEKRLDELTPVMVKEMIYNLIQEHLDWLVVWGGVFGALFGIIPMIL